MNSDLSVNSALTHPAESPTIFEGFHVIEADAGTGKTWTLAKLVERAIREGRYTLDQILVVTFTKAATAELKSRIAEFLTQLHAHCEAKGLTQIEARRVRMALAQIDSLNVQTINGFCQSLIAENRFALDLPDSLAMVEDASSDVHEMMAQWWREQVLSNGLSISPEYWAALFAAGLSLKGLETLLGYAAADPQLCILPAPTRLLGVEASADNGLAHVCKLSLLELESCLIAFHEQSEHSRIDVEAWLLGPARKLCHPGKLISQTYKANHTSKWLESLRQIRSLEDCFDTERLGNLKRFSVDTLLHFIPEDRLAFKPFFEACSGLQRAVQDLQGVNALFAHHLKLGLLQRLHQYRVQKGRLDFDGQLQEAYLLLTEHPLVAKSLRERLPFALLDESQDTDPLQWAIFESIYLSQERGNLLLVGDPKQSIYGFRGADVYTYLKAGQVADQRYQLDINRRSFPEVLDAVNAMFDVDRVGAPVFIEESIEFRSAKADKPRGGGGPGDLSEDHTSEGNGPGRPSAVAEFAFIRLATDSVQDAAHACASNIQRLQSNPLGKANERQEICVLVRGHLEASLVKQACLQQGIACVQIGKDSIWHSRWSTELLIVLKAMENPYAQRSLGRCFLLEAFKFASGEADFEARLQEMLIHANQRWTQLGAQASLAGLLLNPDVLAEASLSKEPDRSIEPLLSIEAYSAFDQMIQLIALDTQAKASVAQALDWVQQAQRDTSVSEKSKPWLSHQEGSVKIMTIHQSKGLQFDTVLVPFAWQGARKNLRPLQRFHRRIDGQWRSVVDCLGAAESKTQAQREQLAEEMRLFYVAVTRAVRRLYVFSPALALKNSPIEVLKLNMPNFQDQFAAFQEIGPERAGASKLPELMQTPSGMTPINQTSTDQVSKDHALSSEPSNSSLSSDPSELAVPEGTYPPAWGWQSYTSLTRKLHSEAPMASPVDYDQGVAESEWIDSPEALGIAFRFAKGAKAGVVLHSLFEHHPFDASLSLSQLASLTQGAGLDLSPEDLSLVGAWLDQVLATPILALKGCALREVPASQRRVELAFTMEMDQLDWGSAIRLIASHYPVSLSLRSAALQELGPVDQNGGSKTFLGGGLNGFLNGFMDLVFEHEGLFYILDWKSNFLGEHIEDYSANSMRAAIEQHDYAVQWCLYSVALLRWMRQRFPGQDPATKLGGVLYAFVRGMNGLDDFGVFFSKLPTSLVIELDLLVGYTAK